MGQLAENSLFYSEVVGNEIRDVNRACHGLILTDKLISRQR
jgi:hypothetical protein